ncbi:MAG: response regulator transcription factor [Pseudomonadota bacterium]
MRLLLIEDEHTVADYIIKGLNEQGHLVEWCDNGKEGLIRATTETFNLLIIDRMLPQLDGIKLVTTLRATDNATPILMLTALGDVEQRVEGLRAGADDYLVKPFAFSELMARIEALSRRAQKTPTSEKLVVADLEIDTRKRQVFRQGKAVKLHQKEYQLLEYLVRNEGQVVTRTMLLEQVWEFHFDPQTNLVDVHVSRLRAKIDKDFTYPLIHTVRGAGYVLKKYQQHEK